MHMPRCTPRKHTDRHTKATHHADVAVQHGRVRVDGEGAAEVILRKFISLLPKVDLADAVPGIVVAIVLTGGGAEASQCLMG